MIDCSPSRPTNIKQLRNGLAFARAFLRNAGRVGAVAPSGGALAALMTAAIAPDGGPVVELGPGTGVFTRALLARGIPEEQLALIETDPTLASILKLEFPRSQVLLLDAAQLRGVTLFKGSPVGSVISGLPLLAMPRQKVLRILSAAFSHLRAEGAFYQFTYGLHCPVPRAILKRLGLAYVRVGFTRANIPPATVYRISRECELVP